MALYIHIVPCPPLSQPENGMINCELGDDDVTSYEDTCSVTCNTGYELTGSETRICQSNGSWNEIDQAFCSTGMVYMYTYQDTRLCVSSQESPVTHKCVIYRNRKLAIFNPLYLYNHYVNLYKNYIFYVLHLHDLTYQI